MKIRAAIPLDAPEICAIWNGIIRDTDFTFTTEEKDAEKLAQEIAADPAHWLVADVGGVAGFLSFGPFRAGPGYVHTAEHSVYVAQGYGEQGIGSALLQAYESRAKARGIHVAVAGISATNLVAIAFHGHHGYAETARMSELGRKEGKWLDLVLMQKILS